MAWVHHLGEVVLYACVCVCEIPSFGVGKRMIHGDRCSGVPRIKLMRDISSTELIDEEGTSLSK